MPAAKYGENPCTNEDLSLPALFSVAGKNVLITGGGSGIGAMMASGFVQAGANVYICSRKDTSSFASNLSARGPGVCHSLRADLASEPGIASLAKSLPSILHVLINNSGTNWSEDISTYPGHAWDKVMALNVRTCFQLVQACLPKLEAAGSTRDPARVINIASIEGLSVPAHDTYAYSTGKAAVSHLSRVLAGRLAERNITVNSIAPGPFPSRMMAGTLDAFGDLVGRATALGRIGSSHDMAGTAIFLASRAGAFITGAEIIVDGGMLVKPVPMKAHL